MNDFMKLQIFLCGCILGVGAGCVFGGHLLFGRLAVQQLLQSTCQTIPGKILNPELLSDAFISV